MGGNNANTSSLYAETTPNINKATVTATGSNYDNVKNDFANDPNYGKLSVEAIVINGELKLGVGISANNNWVMFDNFTLTYYGTDLSELQKLLSQVVNTSQTLINNKTLPTTAEANLQKITTDNNPENGYENAEDYENAISTINAAYEKYNALVTPYAAYRAFRDNFVNADILDVTGVYTDANNAVATLNGAIEAANTAVEAATEISAITEQTAKLREAALKFIKTVTIKEGKYFDLTKLMVNPGFDNNTTEGWNITHTGDLNTRVQCNEFYQATFDMYQTLTGLPNGSYTLSVKAFMRPGWADAVYTDYTNGINKVSAKLYVNNDESTIKNIMEHLQDTKLYNSENGGLADSEVNGKFIPNGMEGAQVYFGKGYYDTSVAALVNDGNLKLGFKNETSEGGYWTIFDDFRLHYYGTSEFIYKKQYFPQVQAEAQATLNNKLYENVAGAEKANLITAVAITPADTEEAYDVAITQIKDAQTAFIVVAPSYNRLVAAIATAKAQEVDCTDAESTLAAVTTTAEAAVSAANTLYTTVLNTFSMDEIQFGFVAGEYAPYNNVKAIQTYNKKAEAINNIASQSEADVNAMIEELKSVEWNVNTEEVNAVYDGNFAIQEAHENSGGLVLAGWDNSDDLLRQLVKNTTSYPGLSDADAQAAVFGWTSSHSYGKEAGYTLPLASHTIYELSYKYAGWATEDGENGRRSVSASILNAAGETIATITPEGTCGIGYNNALKTAVLRFQTEEAENYTLVMTNNGNTVFTDIELLTAKAEDITVKVPAEYGTMILPFEAEIPAGMKVFGVENTTPNGMYNTLNLEPVLDKIEANTPYIVQKTDEVQSDEFVFNGVAYSDKDTYTSGLLTGAVKAVQAPTGSYVLQKLNNVLGFYKVVEGKSITVTAYHAYLAIAAASEVRAFVFDLNNDVTSVAAAVSGEDALTDVYSVNGVLVRKGVKASEALDGLQKGLYIVNGVKKAVR